MSTGISEHGEPAAGQEAAGKYRVDARGAQGVQAGEGNTQINYFYGRTVTDGVAPPPLADVHGVIASPYRGLAKFEERDAVFFFGREAAATEVLERMSLRLQGPGLLVVSGVSGAGKSSLVRAGVLPRIRGAGLASVPEAAGWPAVVVTPETAPLDELATRVATLAGTDAATVRHRVATDPAAFAVIARQTVLAPSDGLADGAPSLSAAREGRLLLVVDQFEQLFKCPEEQQRAFITALHAAATVPHGPAQAPAALVVLVVRADFEARCADFPQLETAVKDRYLVTAMKPSELRMAITEPARRAGSRVDDDLIRVLLEEAGGVRAGVLPLLSHALDQAWRGKAGRNLTQEDYARTGGIEGAVAGSAQQAYQTLTPAQQAAARLVFTRLTAATSEGTDTARRADRAELLHGKNETEAGDLEAVLEVFAANRLLTLAAGTVEISHEVLLTAWPLLRDTWLADTHTDRIVWTRLRSTAKEWDSHHRDSSYLYGGSLLATAIAAAVRINADPDRHLPLSPADQDFLDASQAAHHRSILRRLRFTAALAVLLVIAAGTAGIAIMRSSQLTTDNHTVSRQRDEAVGARVANLASTLGATDPITAKRLAIAADRLDPGSIDSRSALAALYNQVEYSSYLPPGINGTWAVAADGTGHLLAYGRSYHRQVKIVDLDARRVIRSFMVTGAPIHDNTFAQDQVLSLTSDGRYLSVLHTDNTISIYDTTTGRSWPVPLQSPGPYTSAALSATGDLLMGTAQSTRTTVWDTRTGKQLLSLPKGVGAATFLPHRVLVAAVGASLKFWDIGTGKRLPAPRNFPTTGWTKDPITDLAASPDGSLIAAVQGNDLQLVHLGNFFLDTRKIANYQGNGLAVSADGKYVDLESTVWDTTNFDPGLAFRYTSTGDGYEAQTFGHGDRTLRGIDSDGTANVLSLASITGAYALPSTSTQTVLSKDGSTLAAQADDGLEIWDPVKKVRRAVLPISADANALSTYTLSDDGRLLANAQDNGRVDVWDTRTATKKITLSVPVVNADDPNVAFSPDDRTLAVVPPLPRGTDKRVPSTLQLWDLASATARAKSTGDTAGMSALDLGLDTISLKILFSTDGRTVISAADQGVVDPATGRRLTKPNPDALWTEALSSSGVLAVNNPARIAFFNGRTLQPEYSFIPGGNTGTSASFSPDGQIFAVDDSLGEIHLWDVTNRRPFGSTLTGYNIDPTDTIATQGSYLQALAFTSDGSRLLTVDSTDHLRTYLIGAPQITQALCAQVGPLSRADWRTYLPGIPYRNTC